MKTRKKEADSPELYGGPPRPRHHLRMRVVFWVFLLVYAVIAGRLAQLQLRPDVKFSKQDLKHIAELPIQVPRGQIVDHNGVVLATDKMVYSLWADPREIEDPEAAAARLQELLDLDPNLMRERLKRTDAQGRTKMFSWVRRWMAKEEIESLGDLSETLGPGFHVRQEPLRFYPQGDLAAHVLGYVNLERKGSEGVELKCDKYLSSTPGVWRSRADARRNLLNSLTLEYQDAVGGADVRLTIDAVMQKSLERELDKAMVEARSPRALGMVMDPKTGAVLALACRPSYDPNRFWEYDAEQRKNRAYVDVFEPGSAFKIVTASAALERNLVWPEKLIDCHNGSFNPYGHTIRDYHPLGVVPFSHAFAESSNVGIIQVGSWLGPAQLEEWIRRFGFGQRTSPDFVGESRGIFRSRKQWSGLTMGSLPMGQEISVTVPQLARAFAAIANGGYLVTPYMIESAVDRDGSYMYVHEAEPPVQILSQKTAETMKELCHLVATDGTGNRANIKEYRVGGKTGTAQIALPGRGYIPGKFTAIFAGFAPIADPKLCAVIVVQEPEIRLHFGGWICGPIFRNVIREALIRMNCPEDPVVDAEELKDAPVLVEDADTVVAALDRRIEAPAGDLPELGSLEGLELATSAGDSSDGGPVLPDLRGLTKSQAMARIAALNISWDAQGTGWVKKQVPPPGTPLSKVTVCRLEFSSERATEKPNADKPR